MTTPNNVQLVVQYILEHRGTGHFLPYSDYAIIKEWVAKARGTDQLLLVLSDILPEFYDGNSDDIKKKMPRSLAGLKHKVLRKLDH